MNHTLLQQITKKDAKAFTHSGKFHADDVFSSALLLYLNPEITIISQTKDCLHKRINTRRITNAGIGEQEKDRVYAPLRF